MSTTAPNPSPQPANPNAAPQPDPNTHQQNLDPQLNGELYHDENHQIAVELLTGQIEESAERRVQYVEGTLHGMYEDLYDAKQAAADDPSDENKQALTDANLAFTGWIRDDGTDLTTGDHKLFVKDYTELRDLQKAAEADPKDTAAQQSAEDAQENFNQSMKLAAGKPENHAYVIAQDEMNNSRKALARKVVQRSRQSSPVAVMSQRSNIDASDKLGEYSINRASLSYKLTPKFLRSKSNHPEKLDSLTKAQKAYEASVTVVNQLHKAKLERSGISDVERLAKEQTLRVLLGDPARGKSDGQLFKLSDEVRKNTVVQSGHYAFDENGDAVVKGKTFIGRTYHRSAVRAYKVWDKLGERRSTAIARNVVIGGLGTAAVVASAPLLGIAGAGLVAVGTRAAKSGGMFMMNYNSGNVSKADDQANDREAALSDLRTNLSEQHYNDPSATLNFAQYLNESIVDNHINPAQESYKANRNRLFVTAGALVGGVAVGEAVHMISGAISGGHSGSADTGTKAPTQKPGATEKPSQAPSAKPSAEATKAPSDNSSQQSSTESARPTQAPAGQQPSPTEAPTESPTDDGSTSGTGTGENGGGNGGNANPDKIPASEREFATARGANLSESLGNNLEAMHDVQLTGDQKWNLYSFIEDRTPNGNFTANPTDTYKMSDGHWGINPQGGNLVISQHTAQLEQQWYELHKDELQAA